LANQLSDLQHLIRQLGPSIPEISLIVEEGSDSWQIIFEENFSLQISWQENPARVLLCSAIGKPDESQREKIFAQLLNMNLLLQGVANLKLALSSPDDDVVLIGELTSDSMTLEILQEEIMEYLRFAAQFSELIIHPEFEETNVDLSMAINSELLRA
jgi:hypothetical protein